MINSTSQYSMCVLYDHSINIQPCSPHCVVYRLRIVLPHLMLKFNVSVNILCNIFELFIFYYGSQNVQLV